MKILLAHNHYGSAAPSGENEVFRNERALLAGRHEVRTVERHSDEIRRAGYAGKLGAARGALAVAWNPFMQRRVARSIKEFQPDILHVHNFYPLLSPAVFYAARGTATATVLTVHNYRTVCAAAILLRDGEPCTLCLERSSVRPALRHGCYRGSHLATLPLAFMIALHRRLGTWRRQVDAFICLTPFQRDTLAAAGFPADKLHVKPNFYPDPPAPRPWAERDDRAIFLGRLGLEKGVDVLLDAWARWGAAAPPLDIAGEGPERARLERRAAEAGLTGKVRFRGPRPFSDGQALLAGARLLVLPTRCYEGFPLVVREAFALGVPVAGSDLGAVADIVTDGVTGVLFRPGDAADLQARVAAAWADPARLAAMGAAARRTFEAEYTAERSYERLMEIYGAAIGNRKEKG